MTRLKVGKRHFISEDTQWPDAHEQVLTIMSQHGNANHSQELHCPSTRMALIKAQKITSMGDDVKKWQSSYAGPGNVKGDIHFAAVWPFLRMLQVKLLPDPAILLLRIYTQDKRQHMSMHKS